MVGLGMGEVGERGRSRCYDLELREGWNIYEMESREI